MGHSNAREMPSFAKPSTSGASPPLQRHTWAIYDQAVCSDYYYHTPRNLHLFSFFFLDIVWRFQAFDDNKLVNLNAIPRRRVSTMPGQV
jgi:hypothetical protein